jgi:hypothetical protein
MRCIPHIILFGWVSTIGTAQDNKLAPFVDYPKQTGAYLQRIQEGEQSHAFNADASRISPD